MVRLFHVYSWHTHTHLLVVAVSYICLVLNLEFIFSKCFFSYSFILSFFHLTFFFSFYCGSLCFVVFVFANFIFFPVIYFVRIVIIPSFVCNHLTLLRLPMFSFLFLSTVIRAATVIVIIISWDKDCMVWSTLHCSKVDITHLCLSSTNIWAICQENAVFSAL